MKKYYTILVVVLIILSSFLCGCNEEEKINYCCKCSGIASTWIPAGSALYTLDMDYSESIELTAGFRVFYLCDGCIEKYGINIYEADSPWSSD